MTDWMIIRRGQDLRLRMYVAGTTPHACALRSGIPRSAIAGILTGRQSVRRETAEALVSAVGSDLQVDDFFEPGSRMPSRADLNGQNGKTTAGEKGPSGRGGILAGRVTQ